jgi:TonB family protein
MTLPMWLQNLMFYSVQVAALIGAGTVLIRIFRLKSPAVLLAFWQILLAACLLLPALQPWKPLRLAAPAPLPAAAADIPLPAFPESGSILGNPATARVVFPIYQAIAWILVCGVGLRLLWLALGLLRLKRYLHKARRLAEPPESIREMKWRLGVAPKILISADIDSPVTFGWRQPVVLLPVSFHGMSESMQRPIACHELLHVERCDWLFVILEEILRSLFWFHPAVWWAVARIHLSREQVVDREVLRITGARGAYLESLLHIASQRGRPVAVPAPLLLRERHLVQRVALMLKESKMTTTRLIFSLLAILAFLVWTGTYAAAWFPLTSAAVQNVPAFAPEMERTPAPAVEPPPSRETTSAHSDPAIKNKPTSLPAGAARSPEPAPKARRQEPLRVGSIVAAARLINKVDPIYPEIARRARVEGTVQLEVLIDEQGKPSRVRIIGGGGPLLQPAALEAVKQWRYSPTLLNGQPVSVLATVEVPFSLTDGFVSPSESPRAIPSGGILDGAPPSAATDVTVQQSRREPIRVGGNVQDSKIIKRVDPIYPEVAKQARVEQVVMLEVSIIEEGYVSNIRVIRGHPLLDQAAIDAVKQWVYSPTMLNGKAVPVIATVTVVFSLMSRFTLDANGYIKDSQGATVPLTVLRQSENAIQITPAPQASFAMIQQTLSYLQIQGVKNVRLNSSSFVFAEGCLFYAAPGAAVNPLGLRQAVESPSMDLDMDQLKSLAEGALRAKSPTLPAGATTYLAFTVCVDETGQVVAVQGPGGTMDVPEITAALRQVRITAPGLLGNVPVPTAVRISVPATLR